MPLFPVFAKLEGRDVLVVGAGEVATRKVEALLHVGAHVRVHASTLNASMTEWHRQGRLVLLHGEFDPAWLDSAWLVVAATDDRPFNAMLAEAAGKRRKLINVVDDAELSTFHVPSIVDRAPLQIAISSGGSAPMLARRLREELESRLDESLGVLADLFALHRDAIRTRYPDLQERRRWFDDVLDGPIPRLLEMGHAKQAEQALAESLSSGALIERTGHIDIVDASQNDPALLTLKALRAMNLADVLVCEAAACSAVIRLARRDATRVAAPESETDLIRMLIEYSGKHLHVVHMAACNPASSERYATMRSVFAQRGLSCRILASGSAE